jgi:uncharacterized protein YyaL (SSP411 family)
MKYLKLVVFIPLLLAASTPIENGSSSINWVDFNTGFPSAVEEGKIAVIDCYTDWCGWCKVMDQKTFSDPAIIKRLNEDYVTIKFNPEKPGTYFTGSDSVSGRQLLNALSNNKPSGYPTFFFFVPQFNKMFQVPGYQDVAKFTETLDKLEEYQNKAKNIKAN